MRYNTNSWPYGDGYSRCDGTCTNCVIECSRYRITVCEICGDMINEGESKCYDCEKIIEIIETVNKKYET